MEPESGWVKLYHPRGPLVTLPVTAEPTDYARMFVAIGAALDAGFLATAPGIEAGEHVETIGHVVQRMKDNQDHSQTSVIDLYPTTEPGKFAILSVYLNNPDQIGAFEAVSGLKLATIPVYVGTNKIERGASRQADQFVVAVPRPFRVVYKDNPKYNPNETDTAKKKPARLFVRWPDLPAASDKPAPQQQAPQNAPQQQPQGQPQGQQQAEQKQRPDNPALRARFSKMLGECKDRAALDTIGVDIGKASNAGYLSPADLSVLKSLYQQTLDRFGVQQPARR